MIETLVKRQADLLAISASMSFHINSVDTLIKAVRNKKDLRNIKILVGGSAFRHQKDLWKEIGADGYEETLDKAVQVAKELVGTNKTRSARV